jgi:nicotinamide riboside transporter PnuC
VRFGRDTRWRIKTIGLSVVLAALAAGLVFAMETWRPLFEPVVKIIEALATRGRADYDPSHYQLWEGVAVVSAAAVVGLAIWGLFGENPERRLDAYLQAKLKVQARDHTRDLKD